MFARATTPRQISISRATCCVISAGVEVTASAACFSNASRSRGWAQARTTSRLSRSMIGARRCGGRGEREPVRHVEARLAGLGEGRHVRQQRAARARDGEAEQGAGLHLRQAGGEAADRHVDAAADHLADRRRDAAERHVQRLDAGGVEEQLHRHVRRRAGPAGAERQLARLLLCRARPARRACARRGRGAPSAAPANPRCG